jgi:hypothetical protein
MRIVEVTTPALARAFIQVNVDINRGVENYIRPLDKDINEVFDPKENKTFRYGAVVRWLLQLENGSYAGRIAAFVNSKYKNKGDEQPTGGFGFFDCIHNQQAANMLLDTAKNWLQQQGMEAMDGPINFGERDRWWGVVLKGFLPPLYGMNYNPPYYQALLENYGMQVFYNMVCWHRDVQVRLSDKFYEVHAKLKTRGGFTAERIRKNDLEKYARDFCTIYNKAWAQHEGNKEMSEDQALKIFRTMKPVMDEDIAWLAYYREEPIAMYVCLPDLNQIFRHFNGRFGLWQKLQFLYYRWRGECTNFVGIIFGIVPRFQGMGIDKFLIVEAAAVIQPAARYKTSELQWQGDFHPKMMNISKGLEFEQNRWLAVYRYLFDRSKEFKRHPMLS